MKGRISNLQEIKDALPYRDFLAMSGVSGFTSHRRGGRSQCPFCMTKNPIAFSFHDDKGWKSFCCGFSGGDVIELIKELHNCTFIEAVEQAGNFSGISVINEDSVEHSKLSKDEIQKLRMEAQYAALWFRSQCFRKRVVFREVSNRAGDIEKEILDAAHRDPLPWETTPSIEIDNTLIEKFFDVASRARQLELEAEDWESQRSNALELYRIHKHRGLRVDIEPIVKFDFELLALEKKVKSQDPPYSVAQLDKDFAALVNRTLVGLERNLPMLIYTAVARMES